MQLWAADELAIHLPRPWERYLERTIGQKITPSIFNFQPSTYFQTRDVTVILRILVINGCFMPSSVNHTHMAEWNEVLAPQGLGYRIKLLSMLLARSFQERLEPFGLTPFHWVVLCCLWQEDGLATSSIGERLQQVGGTLTGVLDRMEERGLVRRERDSRDRRIWRIWLTQAGKELEEGLPPIALEIREQAMAGVSKADRELLSRLIDKAIANFS